MYSVHVDGKLLFSSSAVDDEHIILSPMLTLDVSGAGSLSFILPPGNALYHDIKKLKSIITVKQNDDIIFRGRVLDDEKDFYNQKDVYCEGDRSFLLDSLSAPYAYKGTALGLFEKLIREHNAQVDSEKQFTVGNVTAISNETLEVENVAYHETLKEFDEKLLSVYGGYLMTRTEDGVTFVDWLAKSGDTNSQVIEFSVNLLDIKDKVDASDVFTVLIPLGASNMDEDGEYTEPVNVAPVNNGLKYIQDDDAIALYGKIWRTKTWDYEENPTALMEKAQQYLKTGIALQTLTLNAIDMHFINGDAKAIRIGAYVRILSNPHGLDTIMNCTKLDIDLLNPEKTTYTFGEPPRTLTENVVKAEEDLGELTGFGGGRSVKKEMGDIIRWAEVKVNANEAMIELLTGEASRMGERLSKAEITLDGVNAQIVLKASVEEVDALNNKVSEAEIEIDGMNSEITLKANKVYVDSQITTVKTLIADEIDAVYSDVNYDISQAVSTAALTVNGNGWINGALTATSVSAGGLTIGGTNLKLITKSLLNGNSTIQVVATGGVVSNVEFHKKYTEFHFLGYE